MNRIRSYGPTVVLLVALVAVMVAGPLVGRRIAWAQHDASISLIRSDLHDNAGLAQLSEAFRKVADVVEPGVVSIEALARGGPGSGGMQIPPELERFFDRMPEDRRPDGGDFDQYAPSVPRGQGSGWVYDEEGHIVTNNHVVENADEIRVRFQDGRTYIAEVVGTDPSTDVAVLKIEADNLHPLPIAEQPVEQGDIVFAFGSPFRFEFSMSQGIVSAKARQLGILGQGGYESFIQTDAAINPGNSGGALVDQRGLVIGINTAIYSPSGANDGVGFAVPSTTVSYVVDQLADGGAVSWPILGVTGQDVEERVARLYGIEVDAGALIGDVAPGSGAAAAGVEPGDIVVAVEGDPVDSMTGLAAAIRQYRPGDEVELEVVRDGGTVTLTVTLGRG